MKLLDDPKYQDKNQYPDYIERIHEFDIPAKQAPERLDRYISRVIVNATRNKVQEAIDNGSVTVNGNPSKASYKIRPYDKVKVVLMKPPPIELIPEDLNLEIVYEDEWLMIVNKPWGMCTHPGMGNRYGTLVNGVLWHLGHREVIPIASKYVENENEEGDEDDIDNEEEGRIYASDSVRPGIVHRIDKDTSGLLVIAKDEFTHAKIAEQFASHTSEREYNAILWGEPKEDEGRIEGDIGRSPRDRKLFAVVKNGGKFAITDYWVLERFGIASLVKFKLHTGRTHQIRVHSAYINHPVFGDKTYGGDKNNYSGYNRKIKDIGNKALAMVNRQLLHAKILGFVHPHKNEKILFDSPLPADMLDLIEFLKENPTQ